MTSPNVPTVNGAKITVNGTAQVKINNEPQSLKLAAQHFLSKTSDEIQYIANETLEGLQSSNSKGHLGSVKVIKGQLWER